MTKKNVLPVVVLTVICVVVALLLALVNSFAAKEIEKAEALAIAESLKNVAPSDWELPSKGEELGESSPKTVTAVYKEKNGKGYAVTLSAQGYASKIAMVVTIDMNGKVIKAEVTSEQETHGQSGFDDFVSNFTGKDYEAFGDESFKVSRATVTSRAMKNAIKDALNAVGLGVDETRSEEELFEAVSEYIDGSFEDITPEDAPSTVKKIYREKSGKGYVAYVLTVGQYVPIESEGVIAFDEEGKILGVKLINWVVGGDGASNPTDDFIASFKDKNAETLTDDNIQFVTDVTRSCKNFRDAVKDAAESLGRAKSEILGAVSEYINGSFEDVTPADAPSVVKKIYREKSGKGYVAYVLTVGQYVPIESEGVIAFDADGKIIGLKLINWVVGGDGAANPTDDFVASFVGKDAAGLTDESIDFVTDVTRSCKNFRDAVKAAGESITPPATSLARIVGIITLSLAVAAVAAVIFIKRRKRV